MSDDLIDRLATYIMAHGGAGRHDLLIDLGEHKKQIKETEYDLRAAWWHNHGCPFEAQYGDDGEMSCGGCLGDFLRMPIDQLRKHVFTQRMKRASEFFFSEEGKRLINDLTKLMDGAS